MTAENPQAHPNAEAWADYLYRELPADERARLDLHLRDCAACREQVASWRATQAALDTWKLPARRQRPVEVFSGYARWAVAAAVVLGVGWLGGRLSAPAAPTAAQLRAELLPALRAELRQDYQAQLREAVGDAERRTEDKLVSLAQAWSAARAEDQQATRAAFQRTDQQWRAEQAGLRRDLETVAVVAETAIGATQNQLTRLAGSPGLPAGNNRMP